MQPVDLLWWIGAGIVAAILVQILWLSWDLIRRSNLRHARQRQALELLDLRLAATRREGRDHELAAPTWAGWRKFEVKRRQYEDDDRNVCSFYLQAHDGKPMPSYEPGQFLTFRFDIPEQAKPVVRCYSISEAPGSDWYRITVKRVPAPRGVECPPGLSSNHLHDQVEAGAILDVRAPAGKFVLDPAAREPIVLIAGGVGFTPLLSMLNAVVDAGVDRETWLFYGVRRKTEHIMKQHLERINQHHPNVHLHVCYSDPSGEDIEGQDFQHRGRVSLELLQSLLPSNNYSFYLCGPPPMMQSMLEGLKEWGVPQASIHQEAFGPGRPRKPVAAQKEEGPTVQVTFRRSDKTIGWSPGVGTLLDLARSQGISIDAGCERGNCGTCQIAIRSGEVRYVDEPEYAYEKGTCLVCCAVPDGPLELEA